MATPPVHGAFCEYVASPADFAYKLPDKVSTEAGATIEPLSVGLHAAGLTRLRAGETVVVLGAGPIGLLAVAAANAAGAGKITAVDLVEMRLEAARRFGAAQTVNAASEDVSEALADTADVVMDCVGIGATLSQAFDVARPGGRVAWVGMGVASADLPLVKAQVKELLVTGVFRYANVYQSAVNLLGAGKIDTAPIVTHRFVFPQVAGAVEFAQKNREIALKTMVNFE
jgi:threonine dehydrogenase-like Zn-dependent dehydrogenase